MAIGQITNEDELEAFIRDRFGDDQDTRIRQLQSKLSVGALGRFLTLNAPGDHRIAFGNVASFSWSGTDLTTIVVTHGLVDVNGAPLAPTVVLATPNNPDTADARAPWSCAAHSFTTTQFSITLGTRNNATIGVFSAIGPSWVAIA